jgi:hypothetical protein
MKTRPCPYCGEKIKKIAVFCRYCRHELLPVPAPRRGNAVVGWAPVIMATALIVGSAAFLLSEFLKERRSWLAE